MYLNFTIFPRIIPSQIFTKKMAWVSPVFPRADRPELLRYYLSVIIYSLSKTFYGPQILSIFARVFSRLFAIFLAKTNREQWENAHAKHTWCVKTGMVLYIQNDKEYSFRFI